MGVEHPFHEVLDLFLILGCEIRGGHMPELDEVRRIGELAGDRDDLVLTTLGESLDAELGAFMELLDQHSRVRQSFKSAAGSIEGPARVSFRL
jgi:hypothetical protein